MLLIVDDEQATSASLLSSLEDLYDVWVTGDARAAVALLEQEDFQVLLADFRLPHEDRMNLIRRAKSLSHPPVCILMTSHGAEELAVEAMNYGADDFVAKSRMQVDELDLRISRVVRQQDLEMENVALKRQLNHKFGLENVIAESPPMREAVETIRQAAPTRATLFEEEGPLMLSPTESKPPVRVMRPSTTHDYIQRLMWGLEVGAGARILKACLAVIVFSLLALWFDMRSARTFTNPEAMESAQLGRHLAAWRGYTTLSIRPSTLGLLQRADPIGASLVLDHPVPDLSIAPGFPFLVACLMKVFPFNFTANRSHAWAYQPELLIVAFNEVLFFLAILLLYQLARRLFDRRVAWVSAIIFAGSGTFWEFSVSGLSTMWLLLVFLAIVWCLLLIEERVRRSYTVALGKSLALAGAVGALVGIGGLSRYSFAWMMIPVLMFFRVYLQPHWKKLSLLAAVSFLVVLAPWITRNLLLSHTPFGTAGYALLENTRPFEEDRVERSFDPYAAGLSLLKPRDLLNKFLVNEGRILKTDLPHLGGNWAWSFFLCGLLLPFRHPALRRLRWFLIWDLALMAVVQPLGQTYLSVESPEINSENLLTLLAPLVLVFGSGFFFTLVDQIGLPDRNLRGMAAGVFAVVMCAPLLLGLATPPDRSALSPYLPSQIQRTASMMQPDELMMSDIPWAVAWYGDRPCAWLTLNDSGNFNELDKLEPVQALYLTQRTTDRPFLSEILDNPRGWGQFLLNSLPETAAPHGHLPADFPLTEAPPGYAPAQMFISDKVRWRTAPRKM